MNEFPRALLAFVNKAGLSKALEVLDVHPAKFGAWLSGEVVPENAGELIEKMKDWKE